jgi:xylose dehydrogenase (NAD/NADP)
MINWGFLGAGWIASTALAPAVHEAKNAKLQAVASRDQGRANALQPETIYERYEDLLADPKIDAVYINLANHQHYEWTIAALAAGKHVLCEKPLALNQKEAEAMTAAAREHNRVLVEAVCTTWHPRFIRAIELIKNGDIGELREVNSAFCFPAQIENNYRLSKEMGGGSLLDVGVYQAHVWGALFDNAPELKIESIDRNLGATGIDLTTQVAGQFAHGVKVNAISSFEKPENQQLLISGESASIEFLGSDAFTSWKKPSLLRVGDHVQEFAPIDPYCVMIENFSDHIAGKPALIPSFDQSLYVAKLLDQIKDFSN